MAVRYIAKDSFLHRLDPRAKIFLLGTVIAITAVTFDVVVILALFLTIVAIAYAAHVLTDLLKLMKGLLVPIAFFFIMNLFFAPVPIGAPGSQVLLYLIPPNYIPISIAGVIKGLTNSFRFMCFLTLVNTVFMITPIPDLLCGLVKSGVPKQVAISLSIAFSYIPVMINEFQTIMEAQQSKGASFSTRNLVAKIRAYGSLIVPTLFLTLLRGIDITKAIESKAFSYAPEKRTFRRGEIKFETRDFAFVGTLLISAIVIFALKFGYGWLDYTFILERIGLLST